MSHLACPDPASDQAAGLRGSRLCPHAGRSGLGGSLGVKVGDHLSQLHRPTTVAAPTECSQYGAPIGSLDFGESICLTPLMWHWST